MVLVIAILMLPAEVSAAEPFEVQGSLNGQLFPQYEDEWFGWPVAPRFQQHYVRGGFLDLRSSWHFGIDVSVRDTSPEPGHPPGLSHRVYAMESGIARAVNADAAQCGLRRLSIAHFAYWHVSPTVEPGTFVAAGDPIGWTCSGYWHMHLSEWARIDGQRRWINPLRIGGRIDPYVDTEPPVIDDVKFVTAVPTRLSSQGGVWIADDFGRSLDPSSLSGTVDVRVRASDVQSFAGITSTAPYLRTRPHVAGMHVTLQAPDELPVFDRDVIASDVLPDGKFFRSHVAPGSSQNVPADACVLPKHQPCQRPIWMRAFAIDTHSSFLDTRSLHDGTYQLTISVWDHRNNSTEISRELTIDNTRAPQLRCYRTDSHGKLPATGDRDRSPHRSRAAARRRAVRRCARAS